VPVLSPYAIESTWLVLLVPIFLLAWRSRGSRRSRRRSKLATAFAAFARRRYLALASVGMLALLLRAALLPMHPVPEPGIVDEFSYLLAADTFLSGRVANSSHPLWQCLENHMVVSSPVYVSKYPPAQGLVLAAGILLGRHPWVGVWLSVGAMCAAIVWMLQGWVPPRWALLGGLLAMLRIAVGSYWIDAYWGGAVSAIGGALLYGALPRLMRRRRIRDGLIFGIGIAILANSRPYEGLLAAALAVLTLALWAFRKRRAAIRPLAPVAVMVLLTASAVLAYNAKTTGSPFRMPYQVHEAQYSGTPLFWFQKLRPHPIYRHERMRAFWVDWGRFVYTDNFRKGLLLASLGKIEKLRAFFLGPMLSVCLLALPWALRSRRLRPAFIGLGVVLGGLLLEIDAVPHYAASAAAVLYLLVIQCLRQMRAAGNAFFAVGRAIPVLFAFTVIFMYSLEVHGERFLREDMSWCFVKPGNVYRARIMEKLNRAEGQHLVLVHYPKDIRYHVEWIYNRADIDSSKVVWAWADDLGCSESLTRYYPSRHAWLLDGDPPTTILKPYSPDLRNRSASIR
jgi:hypothetical protein